LLPPNGGWEKRSARTPPRVRADRISSAPTYRPRSLPVSWPTRSLAGGGPTLARRSRSEPSPLARHVWHGRAAAATAADRDVSSAGRSRPARRALPGDRAQLTRDSAGRLQHVSDKIAARASAV